MRTAQIGPDLRPDLRLSTDDVAKSCPVSYRKINQYGGTTCSPNFSSSWTHFKSCMQVNLAMLTVHVNYVKQRVDIVKLLSVSD